jgi:hypothetical protein
MKVHTAENPEKTRCAMAVEVVVIFFRRAKGGHGKAELLGWWCSGYDSHALAVQAAEAWAQKAKLIRKRRKTA